MFSSYPVQTKPMYFFTEPLTRYTIEYFKNVDFSAPEAGDEFWGLFAPGNNVTVADRPFERLSDYEEMLTRLRSADPAKFEQMHKGTAFYLMAWLAFDLRNYEKGLFYIDAAVAEDVRKSEATANPKAWINGPAARFLLIDSFLQVAERTIIEVRRALEREVIRFNAISLTSPINVADVQKFVRKLITTAPEQRTLVSAFYIFLLEFTERVEKLRFRRGSAGGSNQPFTVHLFTGGLILESLLKHYYPMNEQGKKNSTLGQIFKMTEFQNDHNLTGPPETSAVSLIEIHASLGSLGPVGDAFAATAKLRNTTGHNLVWDNVFSDEIVYSALFHQVMNAILYLVGTKGC